MFEDKKSAMKRYAGDRTIDGIEVTVDGVPLDPQFHLKTICDLGFEWTYEGDAPAQLALALLADHLGDGQRALALYEDFMTAVVANFDNNWTMSGDDMDAALVAISNG